MQLVIQTVWQKMDHFSYTSNGEFEQRYAYHETTGSEILFVIPAYYANCIASTVVIPEFLKNHSVLVIDTRQAEMDELAMDVYSIVRQHRTIFDHRYVVLVDVFDAELSKMLRQRYQINFDGMIRLVPHEMNCDKAYEAKSVVHNLLSAELCLSAAAYLYAYRNDGCAAVAQMFADKEIKDYGIDYTFCTRRIYFPMFIRHNCEAMLNTWCEEQYEISLPTREEPKDGIFNPEKEDSLGTYTVEVNTHNLGARDCNNVFNLFADVDEREFLAAVERFREDAERKEYI